NPNARGYFGWADLATAFWLSSAPQFDGRAALPLLDDFDGYYNDPTTWTANHPDGLTIRLTDFTGTAPEVNPDHMPGVEQGMIADLVDVDYVRAGGAREANANDLVIIQGLKGPYNPAQVAPPTITQIYTLLDLDDPDTPEAEPWANFLWAGPTANSQNRPTLMGAGTGAINPMTTVGADMANDADRLYIADSADNNVETYQVVPNGLDGLADESQDEHWMFLGVNSAAGDITTPIDLAVTGDGAGGSYVVVLDSGGANNGYRLLVMDPATLAVMATRDITDEGDITTGALSIAADESGVNVPGDLTAFALLWDDPLGSNSEIGPVGGMNWYVITNP
ncbi:MAG TPA: hypothetical protein VEI97_14835, partial [bacterium]|nr:hypothetical protein [bacterium]